MCVNNTFGRRKVFLNSVNKAHGIARTITTCEGQRPQSNFIKILNNEVTDKPFLPISEATKNGAVVNDPLRLRRLTEKECFRLMGFDDSDCDILKENGISMTQIYKQAGNSIVVDVLEALFTELFKAIEIKEKIRKEIEMYGICEQ